VRRLGNTRLPPRKLAVGDVRDQSIRHSNSQSVGKEEQRQEHAIQPKALYTLLTTSPKLKER